MPDPRDSAVPKRSPFRTWWILALAFLILFALAVAVFLRVGLWLVSEDPLDKASAIGVLSGGLPVRALEAAQLYSEGLAPQIWLTRSSEPGDTLAEMGIPFEGEEYYNKRVLMKEGVPETAIRLLEPPVLNTADELQAIGRQLAREKNHTVIIVTSKPHTRRVRLLWRRLASGQGRAIVRAASEDSFDPQHWWRRTRDADDVVHEVLGLFNAWAGLPLRPAS